MKRAYRGVLRFSKKNLRQVTVKFAPGLQVIESIKKVGYAPDGTIDLDTVDGLVRSAALGVEALHDRRELKNAISLVDIQEAYFTFLEGQFGQFYRMMNERSLTPHDVGMALSRDQNAVKEIAGNITSFLKQLTSSGPKLLMQPMHMLRTCTSA